MVENHQQLGKYEILEKIGEGGFGTVYRGRDPLLDREVAIKVLSAEKAAAPDFVERFRREARLAASLRHPNIVTVIEVGEQDGRYYMVMDYLPGGSLRQRMTAGQPMPLSQAPRFCARSPKRWITPTAAISSTATSSRATSSSPRTTSRC